MERQLINYLPFILRDIPAFKAALESQQPEFSALWDSVADFRSDLFIRSAGSRGLSRWEKILGYPACPYPYCAESSASLYAASAERSLRQPLWPWRSNCGGC